MSEGVQTHDDVRVTKRSGGLLTAFVAKCKCGWEGPPTGKLKAGIAAAIHKTGGQIVGWDVPKTVPDSEGPPGGLQ